LKLPRDLTGRELAQSLRQFGYEVTRQTGSHMRLTRKADNAEQHITIPAHDPLRVGMLSAILSDVAAQLDLSKQELMTRLFG
jgi:predicted RNA binding protein YcfA (HicA-like mRNA interferase family)